MVDNINGTVIEATQATQNQKQKVQKQKRTLRSPKTNEVDKQRSYAAMLVVAASGSNLESERFPLYKPFTLSPESADVYIKVNKSTIVHLGTQERFAAEGSGHYVNIQLTNGGK